MSSTRTAAPSFMDSFTDEKWKTHSMKLRKRKREDEGSYKKRKVTLETDASTETVIAQTVEVEESQPVVKTVRISQRALTVPRKGEYEINDSHPIPELDHEHEVVIHNHATGLNPIDWKTVDYNFCMPEFPWINGREMAGVVEKVGSEVSRFRVGDKVWTSTYYRDRRAGCFQEFVTVPEHTVSHIPGDMTFEQAACLGVAALTSAMTLWKWLDVPRPSSIPTPPGSPGQESYILIWGGSAITGQFAIQLSKLAGLKVISVCSNQSFKLVQSLGADHIITRDEKTNDEILEEILSLSDTKSQQEKSPTPATDDGASTPPPSSSSSLSSRITLAIDLVGPSTSPYTLRALSPHQPCKFAPLAMLPTPAPPIPSNITIPNIEMKRFVLDPSSRVYADDLNLLFEQKKLKLPQLEVLEGGLDSVELGLKRLKDGGLGGKKLIVKMK